MPHPASARLFSGTRFPATCEDEPGRAGCFRLIPGFIQGSRPKAQHPPQCCDASVALCGVCFVPGLHSVSSLIRGLTAWGQKLHVPNHLLVPDKPCASTELSKELFLQFLAGLTDVATHPRPNCTSCPTLAQIDAPSLDHQSTRSSIVTPHPKCTFAQTAAPLPKLSRSDPCNHTLTLVTTPRPL